MGNKLMKSQSLFELDNNMQQLYDMLNEIEFNQDLDEQEKKFLMADLELALEVTEADKKQKLTSYCWMDAMVNGDIATIDARINALKELKAGKKRIKDRLKNQLKESMNKFDEKQLDLVEFKVYLRNSKRVEVPDMGSLDPDYHRQKITVEPDKTKIKEDLKAGKAVIGAYLSNNQSVIIK
jgi:hypothetical protein